MDGNRVLIIGGDSYIAKNLINNYQKHFNFTIISREVTGFSNENILQDLFDINDTYFKNIDCVINFAAIVHQPRLKDKYIYEKINTKLPIYLSKTAKKNLVKHFIQMSSIAVYGEKEMIDENSAEVPTTIYGITKLAADKTLYSMQDEHFKVSIIRAPMVYGGGNAPGNMMKLINISRKGFPMPFKGVNNNRDFVHIKNLTKILCLVTKELFTGLVIPTDKNPVSTEEILLFVKAHSDSKVRLIKVPKCILSIIRWITPNFYPKIFGSLKVTCNVPESLYKPYFSVENGIKEIVEK